MLGKKSPLNVKTSNGGVSKTVSISNLSSRQFFKILLILLLLYVKSKVPPSDTPPSQERKQLEEPPEPTPSEPTPKPRKQKHKRKPNNTPMPDITKSLPTEEKHRKRSSKDKKSKKQHSNGGSGLLNGAVDSVKKESKRGVDNVSKKASSAVPSQVSDTVEQTKDKVSEGKDQLEQSTKDTAKSLGIPEHFLSTDFMHEAGFDDNDARKLMKAIMEYNQKSMMSSDSEAEQDNNTAGEDQSQGDSLSQEKPQPNGAQTPQTEIPSTPKQEAENGTKDLGASFDNNVKVEPKTPEDPAKLLKNLVGKSVDKNGNIHNDQGGVIGKVTGDITDVEGKKVNEAGDVVDEDGKVFGKIKPVDPTEVAGISVSQDENGQSGNICLRHGDSDLIIKVDATKTGISFSIHIPRPQ